MQRSSEQKHGGCCRWFAKVRVYFNACPTPAVGVDCETARPVWSLNGVFFFFFFLFFFKACGSGRTAEEASGLFPHAWGRARPSDPHSEQPVSMCTSGRACARLPARVCVCVYVYARACVCMRVCTYICREKCFHHRCFQTLLRDRHLCFCGLSLGSRPARMFRAQFPRGVCGPTVIFQRLFCLHCQLLRDSLRLGASLPW